MSSTSTIPNTPYNLLQTSSHHTPYTSHAQSPREAHLACEDLRRALATRNNTADGPSSGNSSHRLSQISSTSTVRSLKKKMLSSS